ncbi:hypothetical protein Q5P01_004537 [Channa striata]|uniref:B30.2/SPRY domain-containing protein n=1 Tax=Channa striata TaxID=64152 RepID=A0AA88NF33_CHASR|nr:hypothetical protein Q5P01_004537 [Channa striata]
MQKTGCYDCEIRNSVNGETVSCSVVSSDACELTLDPNTAYKQLVLSLCDRKVSCVEQMQSYPNHADRFEQYPQLLCRNALTGRCYWEVEWRGEVDIAVAYGRIKRNGKSVDCRFGRNNQSWSLLCSVGGYSVWHDNRETVIPLPSSPSCVSNRVAVYVDCPAGTLSFYSVYSCKLIHLHTFNSTFIEPIYAGFGFGFGFGSWLGFSVFLCEL